MMTKQQRLKIFKKASLCRIFEEAVFDYIQRNIFKFPIYLSAGQEFIPATLSVFYDQLKPKIFAQHRAHHTYLSFGGNIHELIDELLGKENGCSNGMGGSASIQSKSIGMYGHDGLMGSQVPIAVGYSLASKFPTFTFVGDGAAEEDYVMSAIAWAGTKKPPILFIIEDNNLSILTEKKIRRSWELKPFAESIGIQSFDIEDNPDKIWATLELIKTNFPALINIRTERLFWHAGAGIDSYKKRDRYNIELKDIGDEANIIHTQTKNEIKELWKNHLKIQ